ncbi:caldesmon-like [Trifolium pratense]|uniref:Caldesmon-like n=1 Tax=Trifolium pratense TaxID=57577 RepID=A0A2K3PFT1_TRIPR|nr:caldesmon-like [Trifolium pratense]
MFTLPKIGVNIGTTVTSTLYDKYMKVSRDHVYGFEPFDFNLSYFCTQKFAKWWSDYFNHKHLGDSTLISRLESGFTQAQINRIEKQVKATVTKKSDVETVKKVKERPVTKTAEMVEEPSKARKRSTNTTSAEAGPSKKPKPNIIIVSEDEEKKRKKRRKEKRRRRKKEGKKDSEDQTREKKKKKKSKSSSDPPAASLNPSVSNEQQKTPPEIEVASDTPMPDVALEEPNSPLQQETIPEENESNKTGSDALKDSEATISEKIEPATNLDHPDQPNSAETDGKTSPFKEWGKPILVVEEEEGETSEEEEEDFNSEAMKEAEAGGSDILPETSTSKLSASLGLPEEEFFILQRDDPEAALKLLISKKASDPVSSSGPSNSTASDSEINSSVRQDSLISKLYTDFINGDILASVEEHPANAFKYKSFLNKLHNPHTDLAILGIVIQLESILDQFAITVQNLKRNSQKLSGQQAAYDALLEKAMASQSKVDQMKAQIQQPVQECVNNIAKWEAEIQSFRTEIADREKRILEEKAKQAKIEETVAATTQESIRKAAKEGISHFSYAAVIKEEIKSLEDAIKIQEVEVGLIRDHYIDFKSKCVP